MAKCADKWCDATEEICPHCGYCHEHHNYHGEYGEGCQAFLERTENTLFTYEKPSVYDEPFEVLKCRKCGGTTWNVAKGSYRTLIRCPQCHYELTIHDG